MSRNNKYLADFELDDGPVVEVGEYGEQVTIRFDWSVNQRWYLHPEEAIKIANALLAAADAQRMVSL